MQRILAMGRGLQALVMCACVCLVMTKPTFAQSAAVALPAVTGKTLVLGAGDQLRITVFQNAELTVETRVDGDGRITFPFLNAVDVGGKTVSQVEQLIARGLEQKEVLKRPQVTVSMTQYRSQQIAVLGYVNRPGPYVLDMAYTVSGALAQAGGVGAGGADSAVLSRYQDGAVKNIEVDLVQMFRPNASRASDVAVQAGDVLYVHRAPAFYVYGEVQHPGMQRLERDMTVMQALAAGGGLTPRGTERGMRVTRRSQDGSMVTLDVHLEQKLQADDVLYVHESLF
ncbi:MAG: polysaccharide export protein EpsE [Rhizobacter sp.]